MAARTMAASVCLFVCVSGYRLREPRLPCIADVRVLLVVHDSGGSKADHFEKIYYTPAKKETE